MKVEIVSTQTRPIDEQAITLEKAMQRKAQRRRRVAKRMYARFPLFAVELMQAEFPGYTLEQHEADLNRKTRKGKSFRRPKPRRFDWKTIKKEIPDFFNVCIDRTPTRATLHGKTKDGEKFTCIVRATWFGDQRQCRLDTYDLIKLWKGPLKNFCQHPAMILQEHNNEIQP